MNKPELADYGLRGLDSRPQADWNARPASDEERARALEAVVIYAVESERVRLFRNALRDHEWEEFDKENK